MTVQVINARWQMRRKTAAQWASTNEVLRQGEKGYEIDTGREKNGDGVTGWNGLAYAGGSGSVADTSTTLTLASNAATIDASVGYRAKYRLTTTTTAGITITISNLPTGSDEWEAELLLLATVVPASITWAGATPYYMPGLSFAEFPLGAGKLTRIGLSKQVNGRFTIKVNPAEVVA